MDAASNEKEMSDVILKPTYPDPKKRYKVIRGDPDQIPNGGAMKRGKKFKESMVDGGKKIAAAVAKGGKKSWAAIRKGGKKFGPACAKGCAIGGIGVAVDEATDEN